MVDEYLHWYTALVDCIGPITPLFGYMFSAEMYRIFTGSLVRGRGVVFRHYYKSIAKCAGRDYRDGAVVPFE